MTAARPSTPTRAGVWARLTNHHPAWDVLALAVVGWALTFGVLAWQRHDRFASFGFDMGIFDQAVWLAARGKSFITVRGLDLFGHHANVAFYLLAPFSWLGAGVHFLNLLQVGGLAVSAVPLFLLGRHRGLSPWIALVPALAFLLHPTTGYLVWELFHPETVAVVFLLCAYLASVHRRWTWFGVLLVLAVAWKEDVALAAFFLGLLVVLRGDRRVGLWTMGLSLAWFLVVNRFLLGAVNGQGAFYDQFFGDLGGSPFEIIRTSLTDPTRVTRKVAATDAREYYWKIVAPFGGVSLLSPLVVLMGIPQVLGNVLSINSFTRHFGFHYTALPLAALGVAAVEGLARLRTRAAVVRLVAAVMLASALFGAVQWGVSPLGRDFDSGLWPRGPDPRRATKQEALGLVPGGAGVSATYHFVPHLSHRERIYEWPNPFGERNWGVRGEGRHDPRVVDWIVVDYDIMGEEDRALFERVVAEDFDVVLARDRIVVARRR